MGLERGYEVHGFGGGGLEFDGRDTLVDVLTGRDVIWSLVPNKGISEFRGHVGLGIP